MTNREAATLLRHFADLLEIQEENPFRVQAYRRAAEVIDRLSTPVALLAAENSLTAIPGIGSGIAAAIDEILGTGRLSALDALQGELPGSLVTLLELPGIGPKTVGRLYRELGIATLADLEEAALAGRIRQLKGLGANAEQRILEGIRFLRSVSRRLLLGELLPMAERLACQLAQQLGAEVAVAGSIRRMRETVGNINLVAAVGNQAALVEALGRAPLKRFGAARQPMCGVSRGTRGAPFGPRDQRRRGETGERGSQLASIHRFLPRSVGRPGLCGGNDFPRCERSCQARLRLRWLVVPEIENRGARRRFPPRPRRNMNAIIRTVEAIPARVPFRRSFVIGRGAVGAAGSDGEHVFVRIELEDGRVGWGECRALPSWAPETVETITTTIRRYLAPLLVGRSPWEWHALRAAIAQTITPAVSHGQPFACAAIEIAVHDLQGQLAGVPIWALLGGRVRRIVPLTYALSIASPEEMAAQAAEAPECGCLKVKIAGDPAADAARIRTIAAARPDATLWLDANQSYAPANLVPLVQAIRDVPQIFCLEQPVASTDWFGMRQARQRSPWPVAVDEGCFSAEDVARVARLDAAELLVLKVCKSGGLRGAVASATVARALGLGLLGSGLTESGIGFAAAIHLFATIETLLPPELNGVQFLESMWVEGLTIEGACVRVPEAPGLGVRVDEAAIRAHALPIG